MERPHIPIACMFLLLFASCTTSPSTPQEPPPPELYDLLAAPSDSLGLELTLEGFIGFHTTSDGRLRAFLVPEESEALMILDRESDAFAHGFPLQYFGEFIECSDDAATGTTCTHEIDNDHYTVTGVLRRGGDRYFIEVTNLVKTNDLYK